MLSPWKTVYKAGQKSPSSQLFVVWECLVASDTGREHSREIASLDFRSFSEAARVANDWNGKESNKDA